MSPLDQAFVKGATYAVSFVAFGFMIDKSGWPDFIQVPVLLFVLAGLGYGAWQERKRGYQNPPPWWERRR